MLSPPVCLVGSAIPAVSVEQLHHTDLIVDIVVAALGRNQKTHFESSTTLRSKGSRESMLLFAKTNLR